MLPPPLSATTATNLEHFALFSLLHGGVVLFTAGFVALIVVVGRRWRGSSWQRPFEWALAGAALVVWIIANGYYLTPERFSLSRALPLHVTDLLGLIGPLVLVFGRARPLRALLYYWGIGLTPIAFITPDLKSGPALIGFWFFFAAHVMILVAVVYDLLVRDFRPDWRDWRTAVAMSLLYVVCITPLNLLLQANYGFLGKGTPGQPSLIDLLPDWPWRVFIMVGLTFGAMAVLTLPWTSTRRPA